MRDRVHSAVTDYYFFSFLNRIMAMTPSSEIGASNGVVTLRIGMRKTPLHKKWEWKYRYNVPTNDDQPRNSSSTEEISDFKVSLLSNDLVLILSLILLFMIDIISKKWTLIFSEGIAKEIKIPSQISSSRKFEIS